jgi:hypothetical protein
MVMGSEDKVHRSHLPIATPERTGLITYDAKDPDSKLPPRLRAAGGIADTGRAAVSRDGKTERFQIVEQACSAAVRSRNPHRSSRSGATAGDNPSKIAHEREWVAPA